MARLPLVLLLLSGCRTQPLELAHCPCATGWECCPGENVCVSSGTACPEPPPDSGAPDFAPPDLALSDLTSGPKDLLDAATPPLDPPATCVTGRWCWMTPQPTGDDYAGIWGTSSSDLWLATESGTIVHFDGNNLETRYQSGSESFSGAVSGRAADDVWFLFNDSTRAHVLRWDGSAFVDFQQLFSTPPPLYAMAVTAQSSWLVGEAGTILRLPYFGPGSYSHARPPDSSPVTANSYIDVWAADDEHVWVLDERGFAYSGGAKATSWTAHDPQAPNANTTVTAVGLWGTGPNDIWVVQDESAPSGRATVARHFDGSTFTRTVLPDCVDAYRYDGGQHRHVWAASASDVWVTGKGSSCVHHWDGNSWSTPLAKPSAYAVLWSDGADTFTVGEGGRINRLTTGAWSPLAVPLGNGVRAVSAAGDDDLYAIDGTASAHADYIVHFDGLGWHSLPGLTPANFPPYDYPETLFAAGAGDLWVAGYQTQFLGPNLGFIQHWNGSTWDRSLDIDTPARTLWGASASDIWAGGQGWLRRWDGQKWTLLPMKSCVYSITGHGAEAWIHGTDTANESGCTGNEILLHWDGSSFASIPTPGFRNANFESMAAFAGDDLWLASGAIAHWNGAGWSRPAMPPDTTVTAVWGRAPDDVWFAGAHLTRAAILHWDGVILTEDVGAHVGGPLFALTGTADTLFTGGQGGGVLRGAPSP